MVKRKYTVDGQFTLDGSVQTKEKVLKAKRMILYRDMRHNIKILRERIINIVTSYRIAVKEIDRDLERIKRK